MNVISIERARRRRRQACEQAFYQAIALEQHHFNATWENLQKLPPHRIVQIFQKSLRYGLFKLQDLHQRFD